MWEMWNEGGGGDCTETQRSEHLTDRHTDSCHNSPVNAYLVLHVKIVMISEKV